jgi:hypothetical protein
MLFSEMWRRIIWHNFTNVSGERDASVFWEHSAMTMGAADLSKNISNDLKDYTA